MPSNSHSDDSPRSYSLAELDPVAERLVTDYGDVVMSAGPLNDRSGVGVALWSTARDRHAEIMKSLNAHSAVRVVFERYVDSDGDRSWGSWFKR
ncbi:hypothetical protein ACFVWG_13025 [Kribbella sp. NPDC058245]|uniref:hypothetical protein n=1 Tax=Kribbella sp. NPDC058245 TaxID=3346399 RepID=UPI0036E8595C